MLWQELLGQPTLQVRYPEAQSLAGAGKHDLARGPFEAQWLPWMEAVASHLLLALHVPNTNALVFTACWA